MSSKKRLGRGLSALIQSGTSTPEEEKSPIAKKKTQPKQKAREVGNYRWIPVEQIQPNPHQPRKSFCKKALDELANSIRAEGLLQPIVVRAKDEIFELIAGERRLRAFQNLGEKEIIARVIEATDKSSATLALIENLQRENLNPLDEALSFSSLLHDFDLTQEDVAKHVGKARSTITNSLRLLTLPSEIQKLLRQNKISTGHAKAILSLPDPEKQIALSKKILTQTLSVRETEKRVQNILFPEKPKKVLSDKKRKELRTLEEKITEALKTSVKIRQKLKQGTLSIQYNSPEELQTLLEKFGVK